MVLVTGLVCAALLAGGPRLPRRAVACIATVALAAGLAGPTAYTLATATAPHRGAVPSAGPPGGGWQNPPPGPMPGGPVGSFPGGGGFAPPGGTFLGGLLGLVEPGADALAAVGTNASDFIWAAAVVGSNNAAAYQLALGTPVMAVGGYNGTDPAPTLGRFQQYVDRGAIHYFIDGGMAEFGQPHGGSAAAAEITRWVRDKFTAHTVDGVILYDLTEGR